AGVGVLLLAELRETTASLPLRRVVLPAGFLLCLRPRAILVRRHESEAVLDVLLAVLAAVARLGGNLPDVEQCRDGEDDGEREGGGATHRGPPVRRAPPAPVAVLLLVGLDCQAVRETR